MDGNDGIRRHPLSRYPHGWFAVARSDEVPAGAVRAVSFMGTEIVLLRTNSGKPCVFDAWCIHLGAHLGHGGVVEGDRLICPFHGWEYGPDGRCKNVPYAGSVPPDACLRAWPVRERNGAILVWHHGGGRDPFYEIPDFPTDTWADTEWHELQIEMHIYDVIENGVDSAHFPRIHGCRRAETRLIDHTRIPLHFDLLTSYPGEGIGVPGEHVNVTTTWRFYGVGMAEAVSLAEDFGMRVRQLFHFTPVGEQVHFRIAIPADKTTVPEELREFVAGANGQLARDNLLEDAPIWKHKRFNARPKLSDSDGPIGAMRQWACQFFPELAELLSPRAEAPEAASLAPSGAMRRRSSQRVAAAVQVRPTGVRASEENDKSRPCSDQNHGVSGSLVAAWSVACSTSNPAASAASTCWPVERRSGVALPNSMRSRTSRWRLSPASKRSVRHQSTAAISPPGRSSRKISQKRRAVSGAWHIASKE